MDGQFSHPLVVQAKLQIASACHAYGKTPSHCVVTEFKDDQAIARAATQAARQFGYTRMWSIHPSQVRPILAAFARRISQAAGRRDHRSRLHRGTGRRSTTTTACTTAPVTVSTGTCWNAHTPRAKRCLAASRRCFRAGRCAATTAHALVGSNMIDAHPIRLRPSASRITRIHLRIHISPFLAIINF